MQMSRKVEERALVSSPINALAIATQKGFLEVLVPALIFFNNARDPRLSIVLEYRGFLCVGLLRYLQSCRS
jgi:hypothetical protein